MRPLSSLRFIAVWSLFAVGLLACKGNADHGSAISSSTTAASSTQATQAAAAEQASPAAAALSPATTAAAKPQTTGAATQADLSPIGLPLYPNVFESAWTGNFSDDKEAARVGQMSSHDTFDQVYRWYKDRMPASSESAEAAASNHTTDDGDRVALFDVGTTADARMTRVMLMRDKSDDYTIINLSAHSTK
jgi:hypothetical protein